MQLVSQPARHLVNQPPVCPGTQASVPKPIYLSVKARASPCTSPPIEQYFLCFVVDAFFVFCGSYKSLSCIPWKKRSMGCNVCPFSFVSEWFISRSIQGTSIKVMDQHRKTCEKIFIVLTAYKTQITAYRFSSKRFIIPQVSVPLKTKMSLNSRSLIWIS
jgi:hypothetical protein